MFSLTSCCFGFPNLHAYLMYLCCYLLIVVAAGSRVVHGLKCYCNTRECDVIRALDCPGKGLMLWDPCKCCRICAKTVGESCGGPGGFSGQCEPPLQCVTMLPITSGLGVCRELPIAAISATYQNRNINNNNYNNNDYKNNNYKNNDYKSINNYNKNNKLNCTKARTLILEPGCEITNTRCQCWPAMRLCRNDDGGAPTTDTRWHFKTLEDCQLNLQNLIQIEMEFDEDYTISPSTFTYKKLRRKRRSLRKKTSSKLSH